MGLSVYHQKYANQSDQENQNRANEKRDELSSIFQHLQLNTMSNPVRIAVMGCGDKRFIRHHQEIFTDILQRPVEITTFDISIDHLSGEKNVIEHDCALPLPNDPYDITYAHVLLRFLKAEQQWNVIQNSYDALKPGGLAIHVMDSEDYQTQSERLNNGLHAVPLAQWREKLADLNMRYTVLPVRFGMALAILKD